MIFNLCDRAEQLKRILRVAVTNLEDMSLHESASTEELESYWEPIEKIAQKSPTSFRCLSVVYLETLQKVEQTKITNPNFVSYHSTNDLFDKVFDSILALQSPEFAQKGGKQGGEFIEKLWSFISECSVELWHRNRNKIIEIVHRLCITSFFLEIFVDSLMLQFFQECFTKEKREIVFYFFKHLHPKISRNSDVNLGVRNCFFHTLKRYCQCLSGMIDPNEIEKTQFALKTLSFVIRLYRALIEDYIIEDFEEFFDEESELERYEMTYFERVTPVEYL